MNRHLDLPTLIDQMRPLHAVAGVDQLYRNAFKALVQTRTADELRRLLAVGTLRDACDVLADLERRNLVQPIGEERHVPRKAERRWGLHPLFLTRLGLEPSFYRAPEGR